MPDWKYYNCCYSPEDFLTKAAPFGFCYDCWVKAGSPQAMGADTLLNDEEQATDGGVKHG
jgi:hypothetical protein